MPTTYLIVYGRDPSDRLAAYSFPTRAAAWEASTSPTFVRGTPDRPHMGGSSYVIEGEQDVTFGGGLLTAVFNGLTNSGIKKFESRTVGIKRLLSVLPQVAQTAITQPKEESEMEGQTETANSGAEPAAARRGRASSVNQNATVHMIAESNPKRAGSAAYTRYALYQEGMTVAAFLAAGGEISDIHNDTKKGFVTLN